MFQQGAQYLAQGACHVGFVSSHSESSNEVECESKQGAVNLVYCPRLAFRKEACW